MNGITSIAVIGSGISGLATAHALNAAGRRIALYERSRTSAAT